MMKRYSAVLLLLGTLCAGTPAVRDAGMGAASRWRVVPNKRADMLFVEPAVAL
jgi:hypothetical protein